jgi:hypothetical protein
MFSIFFTKIKESSLFQFFKFESTLMISFRDSNPFIKGLVIGKGVSLILLFSALDIVCNLSMKNAWIHRVFSTSL